MTERDEATGLDHTTWRKYEQNAGRWTSPDPYKGNMNKSDPQSFNRYTYVQNNSVNYVDPEGLQRQCNPGEMPAIDPATGQETCVPPLPPPPPVPVPMPGPSTAVEIQSDLSFVLNSQFGGITFGHELSQHAISPTSETAKPIYCQPDVIAAMLNAYTLAQNGRSQSGGGLERSFGLTGSSTNYQIHPDRFTNQRGQHSITIYAGMFANFHTHADGTGAKPSTPYDNAAHHPLGDTGVGDKYHIDVYVMSNNGLWMYDHTTKERKQLRPGREWQSAENCK
jgi:RHS repeat-associated protein